jgi:hypothetical protein
MRDIVRPALEAARGAFAALPDVTATLTDGRNDALHLVVQDGSYTGEITFQPLRACDGCEGIRYEIDTAFRKKTHWISLAAPSPARIKTYTLIRKFLYWLYNDDEPSHLARFRDNALTRTSS